MRGSLNKKDLGSKGGEAGLFVYENSPNADCHKFRTCILIHIALVDENRHIQKNRHLFMFTISGLSGHIKDFLKP